MLYIQLIQLWFPAPHMVHGAPPRMILRAGPSIIPDNHRVYLPPPKLEIWMKISDGKQMKLWNRESVHLLISQINFLILFLYHTQHCSGITPGKSAAHAKGFGKEGGCEFDLGKQTIIGPNSWKLWYYNRWDESLTVILMAQVYQSKKVSPWLELESRGLKINPSWKWSLSHPCSNANTGISWLRIIRLEFRM